MKQTLLILLLLIPLRLFAPSDKRTALIQPEAINPFEQIMSAIIRVEVNTDSLALNVKEQACGPFQIRPIRISDYNRRTGSHYMTWDCFDYEIGRKVFLYYASQIGPYEIERIARNWNGSGRMTDLYWRKVKQALWEKK